MASNLRTKIPQGDTLLIHDRDSEATARFVKEASTETVANGKGAEIQVLPTPREVAEASVRLSLSICTMSLRRYVMSVFYR